MLYIARVDLVFLLNLRIKNHKLCKGVFLYVKHFYPIASGESGAGLMKLGILSIWIDRLLTSRCVTSGTVSVAVLFLDSMQEMAGGCIDPRGTVKIIQEAIEASKRIFPFCHLSARLPQKGAAKNSIKGRTPKI